MAKAYNSYSGGGSNVPNPPILVPKPPTAKGDYVTTSIFNTKIAELQSLINNLPTTPGVDNSQAITAINNSLAALTNSVSGLELSVDTTLPQTISELTTTVNGILSSTKPALKVKSILPLPNLLLFESMIHVIGGGTFICVADVEIPVSDDECYWIQL